MKLRTPTRGWSPVAGLAASSIGCAFAATLTSYLRSDDVNLAWFALIVLISAAAFCASEAVVALVEPTRWRMWNWLAYASWPVAGAVILLSIGGGYGWAAVTLCAWAGVLLGAHNAERLNSEPQPAAPQGPLGGDGNDTGALPFVAAGAVLLGSDGDCGGE